jgi:hypothetical protein
VGEWWDVGLRGKWMNLKGGGLDSWVRDAISGRDFSKGGGLTGPETEFGEEVRSAEKMSYEEGAFVWVKLSGRVWWPGQVTNTYPSDLLKKRKNPPLAVAKFPSGEDEL